MPPREGSRYRLLVEGPDDKWAVIHLMGRHGIDWDQQSSLLPFVNDVGGIDNLLESLSTATKTYERLGIVLDADLDPSNRLKCVRGWLQNLEISLPRSMAIEGLIGPGKNPGWRLGLWIMPDNQTPGTLEDFLAKLVPGNDDCWAHARQATLDARTRGAPLPKKDLAKGTLRAWLAWQKTPGMPFGMALKAKVLGHESEEAQRFVKWFKALFLEP